MKITLLLGLLVEEFFSAVKITIRNWDLTKFNSPLIIPENSDSRMARKISYRICKPPWKMMTKQSLFSLVNIMYGLFNTQRVQWMCGSLRSSESDKSWSTPQPVRPHLYLDSSFTTSPSFSSQMVEQAKFTSRREDLCLEEKRKINTFFLFPPRVTFLVGGGLHARLRILLVVLHGTVWFRSPTWHFCFF